MAERIRSHRDLTVYQKAFAAALEIHEISLAFPKCEQYSLTDQIRRSSRSVCGNIAEAWRKRRYPAAFVCKLNDVEGEAAETQVWLEFAVKFSYASPESCRNLYKTYDEVLRTIVGMINHPDTWVILPRMENKR